MASRVIKIQICDRCQLEERSDVVTQLPAGWSRLVRQGGVERELCPTCTAHLMEGEWQKKVTHP